MSILRISLKNFVIVPQLELDLPLGFSSLTGETGAGKSILIDALQLALGQRADASVVHEGAKQASLTASLCVQLGKLCAVHNTILKVRRRSTALWLMNANA